MKIIRNIKPEFVDERGSITNILPKDVNIASALLITSKAGSIITAILFPARLNGMKN